VKLGGGGGGGRYEEDGGTIGEVERGGSKKTEF